MNIRCIALDLDRTTLNGQGKLSPRNREALEYAIRQGVHIVIASGRSFSALPEDVVSVPGIEYAITSNGAAVYRLSDGACLRRFTLTPQSVADLIRLTKDEPVVYETFIRGKAYADAAYVRDPIAHGATPQAIGYIQTTRQPVEDMAAFMLDHANDLDSVDLVLSDQTVKARLWKLLKEQVPDLYITSSVPELLELSHRDGGKHSGVRFVAETLGLSPDQIAACGDGDNDADMLHYVGCGIAMENATPACKEASDCQTLHHTEDGVAHAIYNILRL